ncbi:hypothetical protein [Blautia obeum]|nr:hypothetical protein [Blautia obeum]
MNRTRQILKKSVAAVLCASLILSGSSTAFAAGSYQETEKAALNKLTDGIPETWDTYLENYKKSAAGSKSNMTLKVEDTGRALIGALMGGTDVSWLQSISLDSNISIKDGVEAIVSSVLLNDNKLCDFNVYMDLANMMEYIQIPELSDSYMKAPVSSDSEENSEEAQQFLNTYMTTLSDLTSVLPDSKTLSTLLDRYGNIIIDSFEEGSSVEESVSVDGISEECTAYEGIISEKSAYTIVEKVLTTAKDDEEIKALFDQWSDDASNEENQYKDFQNLITDALDDMNRDDEGSTENEAFSSKVWVNGDGKIVGRQFGITDGTDTTPVFTWKAPSEGEDSALLLELAADDSSFTFTGSGKTADGLLNGDYILAVNGTETVDINVENLETKPAKAGYYNGTFNISFPAAETDSSDSEAGESTEDDTDTSATDMLAGFGAVIKLTSDADADTSTLDLTVTTSGAALATLSITGSYGEGVEIPDFASLDKTYDATDDEAMTEYLTEINWDTFLANVKAAGVPDELATQLEDVLKAAVESASQPAEEENADTETDTDTTAEDDAA